MLEEDLPDLLPLLRPYQRRAAYWMVQREKGDSASSSERERSQFFSPLCMPMDFLDTYSTLFYNPFRYPFSFSNDLVWFGGGGGVSKENNHIIVYIAFTICES